MFRACTFVDGGRTAKSLPDTTMSPAIRWSMTSSFDDVADRPPVDEHHDLTEDVVGKQLGDRVRRRAREAEHHLVAHHRPDLRVTRVGRQAVGIQGGR